jgi:hypothetical protein
MAPANNHTKFTVYEAPDLAVESLTDMQYAELTQEQPPANDWNWILWRFGQEGLITSLNMRKSNSWLARRVSSVHRSRQERGRCSPWKATWGVAIFGFGSIRGYSNPTETAPVCFGEFLAHIDKICVDSSDIFEARCGGFTNVSI